MSEGMISRDTAVLGERMAAVEVEVRTLTQRFVDHEAADERRHRETIEALHELRESVRHLGTSEDEGTKVPFMQRTGLGGMSMRETINLVLLIVGVIGALASALRGEPIRTEQLAQMIQQAEHAEKPAAVPQP